MYNAAKLLPWFADKVGWEIQSYKQNCDSNDVFILISPHPLQILHTRQLANTTTVALQILSDQSMMNLIKRYQTTPFKLCWLKSTLNFSCKI